MLQIFKRFLDTNQNEINRLSQIALKINGLEKKYQKLSDKEFLSLTEKFKSQLRKGQTLDELLPEVYAAVREVFVRKLKVRLYDVQLMAAIVLHEGKIAEQKTGEGKTFSAAPALYLNSLTTNGVHLVTMNDYLARRDCGWLGPVYNALGATVAIIIHEQAFIFDPKFKDTSHADKRLWNLKPLDSNHRKLAYDADITYGTNNEFGFDYLKDNMVYSPNQQSQRGHNFAIVDEVDSILIDEARTPLIISRPAQEPTQKYYDFAKLTERLSKDTDFVVDEKQRSAHLTEHGIAKIEKILQVDNLYEKDFSTLHHLEQALKAKTLFQKDRDYVVKDGEVVIVDEFTGRLMPGRRYSEGLHQAIEAKEVVEIQQESQTLATISFQNYFRMYQKLAGMTGTAATEAEEFHKIYKLEVVVIPTHKPMIRADHSDVVYKTQAAKYTAVANEVERLHRAGQPVLVGTTSIEKNEFLSALLKKNEISHALLNAKNHEREAEIIIQAGKLGTVTVATNMAGRGVDIILGGNPPDPKEAQKIKQSGGLFVIGTERHESRRIDNQLRGRSGRQGDPGASRFYISLEDDLMRIFGGDQVARVMNMLKIPEDTPIEHSMVSKAIESAQVKVEGHNFDIRKTTVEYDDVMNQQRQIIYELRKKLLEKGDNLKEDILQKIASEIGKTVLVYTEGGLDSQKIVEGFASIVPLDPNSHQELQKQILNLGSYQEITEVLVKLSTDIYKQREAQLGSEVVREMEKFVYLTTLDTLWIEHLDTMDDLRAGIGLRGYAQREPLIEYKKEGFELFEKLIQNIDYEVVHRIYKVSIQAPIEQPVVDISKADQQHQEALDEQELLEEAGQLISPVDKALDKQDGDGETKVTIERAGQITSQQTYNPSGSLQRKKIGRNDSCWCGKKKPDGTFVKYKHCHYPN